MSLTHIGGVISAQYNGLNYPVTTVEYLVVAGGGNGVGGAGGDALRSVDSDGCGIICYNLK